MWAGRRARHRASASPWPSCCEIVDNELPQRQQEGLETIVGARRGRDGHLHDRLDAPSTPATSRASCRSRPPGRCVQGSAMRARRDGVPRRPARGLRDLGLPARRLQRRGRPGARAASARCSGSLVAVALGYGIYRGGVRLNLSRFFRVTGVVLVLVAAGLVASSLHTAAEAGWVVGGQSQALDLSAVIRPGTVWESLITGMLGIQPQPTVIEVVGWLLYAIPMLAIVLVPDAVRPRVRASGGRAAPSWPPRSSLLVGTLGGNKETSAALAGERRRRRADRQRARSPTSGCAPAALKLAVRPGDVRRHQQGRLDGRPSTRSLRGQSHPGRGRERRRRADAAVLAHPPARPLHAALHRRRARERARSTVTGTRAAAALATRAAARRRRLPRVPRATRPPRW